MSPVSNQPLRMTLAATPRDVRTGAGGLGRTWKAVTISRRGRTMFNLERMIAALKAENERLNGELKRVRIAIAALEGLGSNGGAGKATAKGEGRMSAAGRRRIAQAQKTRWAKWRAQHTKRTA